MSKSESDVMMKHLKQQISNWKKDAKTRMSERGKTLKKGKAVKVYSVNEKRLAKAWMLFMDAVHKCPHCDCDLLWDDKHKELIDVTASKKMLETLKRSEKVRG